MEDEAIINLWKSYDKKLEQHLHFNKQQAEDIIKIKAHSFISSMRPKKVFTVIVGILWVILIDFVLINFYAVANPFFLISMGIQVLLTKVAIIVYLYQLSLIQQVDVNAPVLATQEKLSRLKSSTLWVTRLLFLQFPVWTTFFWSKRMFLKGDEVFIAIQLIIVAAFTCLAIWLFINIKYENRDKKWFRLIFRGKEWVPLLKAMELLDQIDKYQKAG